MIAKYYQRQFRKAVPPLVVPLLSGTAFGGSSEGGTTGSSTKGGTTGSSTKGGMI